MARGGGRDGDNAKEGKDFTWVDMKDSKGNIVKDGKGGAVKTRKFGKSATPEASPKPKARPAAAKSTKSAAKAPAVDPMKGYRKGDVTTSPLPEDTAKAARKAIGPKPNAPKAERPISPTRDKNATGRYSEYEQARLGNVTLDKWASMTRAQREAKGLPPSYVDFVRSGGGLATKQDTAKKTVKPISQYGKVRNPRSSGAGSYNKGGMVTKPGKC